MKFLKTAVLIVLPTVSWGGSLPNLNAEIQCNKNGHSSSQRDRCKSRNLAARGRVDSAHRKGVTGDMFDLNTHRCIDTHWPNWVYISDCNADAIADVANVMRLTDEIREIDNWAGLNAFKVCDERTPSDAGRMATCLAVGKDIVRQKFGN